MLYCLNPACAHPENPDDAEQCQSCGSSLLLQDRYRVSRALGQGGFGATFLAEDISLPGSPQCVIKQLRPAATAPHAFDMARNLFWREAKTLGKIGNHPQIPQLLNFFEQNHEFYLVQEFVDGLTLKGEVKKNGPYSEATARQFLSEVLPIMQYVHQNKVIHRDIKPDNLIRREQDKRLVLIDFGAVKDQVGTTPGMSDQTALTAVSVGTPGYAPPEQLSLRPVYASDLYALGATCIYLLTGRSPKDLDYHPNTGEMMWQKYVHISAHFANVLKKMLEISVRNRYQHSEDVLRALDLEPYLDDLAQGMSTPVSTEPTRPTAGAFGGGATSPRSSRLGAAIRRRGALRSDPTGGLTGGRTRTSAGNVSSGRSSGGKTKQGGLPWLKTKDIQVYRAKGRTDFSSHNISRSELPGENFSGCIFRESKIDKTNFQGANLSSADFAKASLIEANLRESNLSRAYMVGANLQKADLRKADLSYATLTNVNLAGANLCGANLMGAKVTDEQLAQAKTNWFTTMPRKR